MHEIFWPYSRKENLFGHHVLFDHFTKGWFIWITVEPVPYGHLSNTGTSILRSHKFFLPSKMAIHKKNLLMQSPVNSGVNRLRFHSRSSEIIGLPQPINHRL